MSKSGSAAYDGMAARKEPLWVGHGYVNYFRVFQNLMRYRITNVMLVSSLYDLFLFEEDGRFYELVREEYRGLNLSHSPEINHVSSWREAREILRSDYRVDLIICTQHIEDMDTIKFARKVKEKYPNIPLVFLAYDSRTMNLMLRRGKEVSLFDDVYVWSGDFRLIIAIIKHLEDRQNLANDTHLVGVQLIILIEDNVSFYSSYLPILYSELFNQSQRLLKEGVNITHKYLRMRARPKVVLCTTYDEAWSYFKNYKEYILGIISDINFKREGRRDRRAGIRFAKKVREEMRDIPILLQSNNFELKDEADKVGADFLYKQSQDLNKKIRQFININFGFGDFIFRLEDGTPVGQASNLADLEREIRRVPAESIWYHASQNHFSKWLKARTEFALAHKLRPQRVDEFKDAEELRTMLADSLVEYRKIQKKGTITDFNPETFDPSEGFARIGEGSLGGKARGLAFISTLLYSYDLVNAYDGIEIKVPALVVLGTDIFDRFMEMNGLKEIPEEELFSGKMRQRILEAAFFPEDVLSQLEGLLTLMTGPLAVRSSSLLEDSQFMPFAGVYATHMLPNKHPSIQQRLQELVKAVKSVYASVFGPEAKSYFQGTNYRQEEEKMAVIIQELVGESNGKYFFPHISGVAKSYNFYPFGPQKNEDGVVSISMGLGQQVVEGGPAVCFSPAHPKLFPQFTSVEATLKNAPKTILALNLEKDIAHYFDTEFSAVEELYITDIPVPEYASYIFSTYYHQDHVIRDGYSPSGSPVMTFAPMLKNEYFPLAGILNRLLELGRWGMGTNVEIEFAVDLKSNPKTFAILQIRPIVYNFSADGIRIPNVEEEEILCRSDMVLGNGKIDNVRDIIWVEAEEFKREKSRDVAGRLGKINSKMLKDNRNYILIGPGRWGSSDPWLGIPVRWENISNVRIIVETVFEDFSVEPSQGSHFFQNLTSLMIPYFTVNTKFEGNFLNTAWLKNVKPYSRDGCIRHIRVENPLTTIVDGRKKRGVIVLPREDKET